MLCDFIYHRLVFICRLRNAEKMSTILSKFGSHLIASIMRIWPKSQNTKTLSLKSRLVLSRVHMTRFAYVCKFCIYAKFAYVRKSGHVYAFTHVCKICTYAKVGKFAPASDQVQISFCVYAKFAYMQIWSCEQKAKFAHVSIYLIVLNNC